VENNTEKLVNIKTGNQRHTHFLNSQIEPQTINFLQPIKWYRPDIGNPISEKEYSGMIGSLLYLTTSRLDIVFAVGLCVRFQTAYKESHLTAIKRIFRYLIGTTDIGLWYKKGSHFDLLAYCDVNYTGDKTKRKNTSGALSTLGKSTCQLVVQKTKYHCFINNRSWICLSGKLMFSGIMDKKPTWGFLVKVHKYSNFMWQQ